MNTKPIRLPQNQHFKIARLNFTGARGRLHLSTIMRRTKSQDFLKCFLLFISGVSNLVKCCITDITFTDTRTGLQCCTYYIWKLHLAICETQMILNRPGKWGEGKWGQSSFPQLILSFHKHTPWLWGLSGDKVPTWIWHSNDFFPRPWRYLFNDQTQVSGVQVS